MRQDLRPDPNNLARWLRSVSAGGVRYELSFNPLHAKAGLWFQRLLADLPMDAAGYGSGSAFRRADTGGPNLITFETQFQGDGENAVLLQSQAQADRVVANNSTGGGTTTLVQQTADPGGSGRRVWRHEWDCSLLWGDGTAAPGETGRRRAEFRGPTSAADLLPYGVEFWAATSVRLDSSVNWAGMGEGDYIHWFQFHDTAVGGYNRPSVAGYICAANSQRSGDFPVPPTESWFMLYEVTNSDQLGIARAVFPAPPTDTWLYQVMHMKQGPDGAFCKVWHVEEGKAPVLAIDHLAPWGHTDDAGTEYMKTGMYSPGQYKGAVPVRRFWQDGFVQLRAEDVPGMTPERMVACLRDQQRY